MFRDTYLALCKSAEAKNNLMERNPLGFFISSMIAGAFVAFGGFVSTVMGALANSAGCTVTKLIQALLFSSALSLVVAAGGELFTGNNLTLACAGFEKRLKWSRIFGLWAFCWLGNLVGSWLLVILFHLSGAGQPEAIAALFASVAVAKTSMSVVQLVVRGILCNICVCLAVWCAAKLQNESARLIMCIWCILIFMICGFEHSVANMASIGVALLNPVGETITILGYVRNLFFVTIGNILGGAVFLALPYGIIARETKVKWSNK